MAERGQLIFFCGLGGGPWALAKIKDAEKRFKVTFSQKEI